MTVKFPKIYTRIKLLVPMNFSIIAFKAIFFLRLGMFLLRVLCFATPNLPRTSENPQPKLFLVRTIQILIESTNSQSVTLSNSTRNLGYFSRSQPVALMFSRRYRFTDYNQTWTITWIGQCLDSVSRSEGDYVLAWQGPQQLAEQRIRYNWLDTNAGQAVSFFFSFFSDTALFPFWHTQAPLFHLLCIHF